MKTLIEWWAQVVRRLKQRQEWKKMGRSREQGFRDRITLLENQLRLQGTELSTVRGENRQLEEHNLRLQQELADSPMKALIREVARETMQRELQPGGKLWTPALSGHPLQHRGGYQEGRT